MRDIEDDIKVLLAKPTETIEEHTKKVMEQCEKLKEYNYISKEIYDNLKLACKYHDYGKVNEEFQKRVTATKKILFNPELEPGHNLISPFFINKDEFEGRDEDYNKVFYAVLNHHSHVNNFQELEERKEFIKSFVSNYELSKITNKKILNMKKNINIEYEVLTGLLNKCDYSGSGNYSIEYENDFLIKSLNNLKFQWRELQKFLLNNTNENVMVVANTGMGKTEGGLLWIGDNKGFFILPLKTAINSIYLRVKENILKTNIEKRLGLLHSESFNFILNNLKEFSYEDIKNYNKEGKALSMPITITTLDQIFNFIFLYPGYEMKLGTLSYSKIVLDEIQAYSPDLLAYIAIDLKKIVKAGGKFAILTATLPPFIRDYLMDELKEIGNIKYEKFIKGDDRHNIRVLDEEINPEFIYDHYMKKGKKTLVICNTVKKAQEMYVALKEMGIENLEIELLHSKFIRKDRMEKEKNILKFGDTTNKGNKIWISTSLVEASLDIDFDYLFTELNDLSGLFQRLGRVNRKGHKKEFLNEVNTYIFTKINKKLFINGNSGFIDEDIFNLSKKAISSAEGILSEEKKYYLIEKNLTSENIKNSNFNRTYREYKKYMESIWIGKFSKMETCKKFRNIISYKVIPLNIYEDNKVEIEEYIEIINDLKFSEEERVKAKDSLDQFTLQVGIYDMQKKSKVIRVNREEINILDGNYSFELGFQRKKQEEEKKQEEAVDNFL